MTVRVIGLNVGMSSPTASRPRRRRAVLAALVTTIALATSACASTTSSGAGANGAATAAASTTAGSTAGGSSDTSTGSSTGSSSETGDTSTSDSSSSSTFLAGDVVHELSLTFDEAAYTAMLETYASSGDKEWLQVTVTIDGETYTNAGARLKGNSSLRSAGTDSDPQSLPWLIKLDKYVEDQSHDGTTDFVVRSNATESALNEAVALDLLREAGLASQQAALVRLTVNGSAADLRLVIENPDSAWQDDNFDGDGILYKAESTGDYTYRGDDAAAYDDVFDQETGDDDLTPLIELLDFVNNSDDATFAAELADHLDVESFATYLAFEELIDNFDDIDGPGNNSYLYWDADTDRFTVVAWDHNLAFGSRPGGAGGAGGMAGGNMAGGGMPGGGQRPAGGNLPTGAAAPTGGGAGGPGGMGKSNALVTRFLADSTFATLVTEAKADLTATLYADGTAAESITRWSSLVAAQASDLVSADTLAAERAAIEKYVAS